MRDERSECAEYYPGGGTSQGGGTQQGTAGGATQKEAYALNEQTGLYHRLTATTNEYGETTVEVAQEGVEI